MKQMDRRELARALSAFTALGGLGISTRAQVSAEQDPLLTHSEIFSADHLSAHTAANGMSTRPVIRGTLATGEFIEVHESTLPPGETPHPPHRHTHSELLLIRDGKLDVLSDGQHGLVEAGGVIFTASGVLHSLRNVGSVPANYFVVAIGKQKIIE